MTIMTNKEIKKIKKVNIKSIYKIAKAIINQKLWGKKTD